MKVEYIGFGGYMEVPCYQDENGKIYFDENNGRNGLDLYTGAYMDCGEICGEPCSRVTEPVECENPFVRNLKEREYMLLNRLQLDCKYYINCAGKCRSSTFGLILIPLSKKWKISWIHLQRKRSRNG